MSSGSLDFTGEGDQALRALVGSGSTLQLACGFCLLWALLSRNARSQRPSVTGVARACALV